MVYPAELRAVLHKCILHSAQSVKRRLLFSRAFFKMYNGSLSWRRCKFYIYIYIYIYIYRTFFIRESYCIEHKKTMSFYFVFLISSISLYLPSGFDGGIYWWICVCLCQVINGYCRKAVTRFKEIPSAAHNILYIRRKYICV